MASMIPAASHRTQPAAIAEGPDLRISKGGVTVATVALDEGLSAEDHAQHYALAVNGLFQIRPTTPNPRSTLHGLYLGPLHITSGTTSARVTRRTKQLCDRDRFDGIALQWARAGAWQGRIEGRVIDGAPGTMTLFDLTQPFTISDESERDFVIVMIPRTLAVRLAADPATLHGRMIDAADGALLGGFLGGLIAHPDALRADQAPALADIAIELAALALGGDEAPAMRPGTDRRLWVRERVERLVNMRLAADDLTPEWIARKLGLSRTELYTAFSAEGVSRLIWDRRSAAAQSLLADPDEQRSIAMIAQACGFVSKAHFSRAIKQRYGLTPSALRQAALG